MGIKGYKVFNKDWTCRDFKYEVGKIYEHQGNIEICGKGFHFCQKANDCFNYYSFDSRNKVAEVEAIGICETEGNESVTDKIKIIKEISWEETLKLVNTGDYNTGYRNTGDYNTGDFNTGDSNTGNWNTGDWNTGYRNTGDWNTGNSNTGNSNTSNRNTGDYNTGDFNTGNFNTGNWNTGDFNTGNFNTGFFNNKTPNIIIFNKEIDLSFKEIKKLKGFEILNYNYENNWWVYSKNMTNEEKEKYPEHKTTGGYLKTITFKDACNLMWDNLTQEEKEDVKNLPNFDNNIFKEITGIEV